MSLEPLQKKSSRGKLYLAGLGLSFGLELAAASAGGWWLGSLIDEHYGLKAVFRILLMFVFFALSIAHVLRLFKKLSDEDTD